MRRMETQCSMDAISIAFHFNCEYRGRPDRVELIAARVFERVLRAALPLLSQTGPLLVRMDQLLGSVHVGSQIDERWRQTIKDAKLCDGVGVIVFGIDALPSVNRIFSLTLSGRLSGRIYQLSNALARYQRNRFLFSMQVDSNNSCHEAIYLSANATNIGVLRPNMTFDMAWECLRESELKPEVSRALAELGLASKESL
ncbi:hypothetical protein [Rhodoferax sp.]|uniref:hypothetical protein n=1 Tax=Rhodoferax sp. TaxID=50421 RepID=UPI00374D9B55